MPIRWTEAEDAILRDGLLSGKTYHRIGQILSSRRGDSASARARLLGIAPTRKVEREDMTDAQKAAASQKLRDRIFTVFAQPHSGDTA